MMYIRTVYGTNFEFHVGRTFKDLSARDVVEIQADGDELEFIRRHVIMVNDSNGRVITWFGDDAKFIAANALKI